ncbi:hypothetical protein NDU88_004480 [Pleurodeles waltl]|uniref:Uncharacterized protein n=1 Tax=Pleurodeles waltl TaxID=8319 RepID=A0AAV7TRD9_PLEWA|nr:hypothetical protein NDU88_004480 [Pleurodeles waltl]
MCHKRPRTPGQGPTSSSGVQREYVGPQYAQPGRSCGPPWPAGEASQAVGVRHEHPQERWGDVQRPQPSNRSGGSADPEAGHTHNEGRVLAQVHPDSIGSGWGNTLGVPRVAPLSAHLASAGTLLGPSSAGAAPAQHQAAQSRSRPRQCVRDSGQPATPKTPASCPRSLQATSRQCSLGPQG